MKRSQKKASRSGFFGPTAPGMEWHWDGLDDWTTDDIFAKLREKGVDTDAERFRSQAEAAGDGATLGDRWHEEMGAPEDWWGDFSWMAVDVLWERLTPDLLDKTSLNRRFLDLVYDAFDRQGNVLPARREDLLQFVRDLLTFLETFPPEERAERLEEQSDAAAYDLGHWLAALVSRSLAEDPDLVRRLLDVLEAYETDTPGGNLEIAHALAFAGRDAAARERLEEALAAPGAGTSRFLHAAEVFESLGDPEPALELYRRGMAAAVQPSEWDEAREGAAALLGSLGRRGELTEWEHAHRRPKELAVDPKTLRRVAPQLARPAPVAPVRKVGRNDPCPCGSGTKYKKCCGKRS